MQQETKNNKTVILGAPEIFGFSELIKDQFTNLGFTVLDFSFALKKSKPKNIFYSIYISYLKIFRPHKSYEKHLVEHNRDEYIMKQLSKIKKADYALIIRPDSYPISFINEIKNKATKAVAYQWDGFRRFPNVKELIKKFDEFYVYDYEDLIHPTVNPTTNFHTNIGNVQSEVVTQKSAYFIGSYVENRLPLLDILKQKLQENGYQTNIFINSKIPSCIKEIRSYGFNLIGDESISYRGNLETVKMNSLLIDIQNPIHTGLSFRAFEALGYNKKLITTNKNIENYDFYRKENIFILQENNVDGLDEFLKTPYLAVDEQIIHKYSFENWINYLFNIQPFTPIAIHKPKI